MIPIFQNLDWIFISIMFSYFYLVLVILIMYLLKELIINLFVVLQKITVAECIETQSKAMTMLTIDQLSYLLKFALQKIKQPGVRLAKIHSILVQ